MATPDLDKILQILALVERIIALLKDMGLKVEGTVSIPQLLALLPH